MKTLEHIISLTALVGNKIATNTVKLPEGKITHVALFYKKDYSLITKGFVRAAISDGNGVEVSKVQCIDNYRDREAGYLEGKKPLNIDGGNNYTLTVLSTEIFEADFMVEAVFVYENPCR